MSKHSPFRIYRTVFKICRTHFKIGMAAASLCLLLLSYGVASAQDQTPPSNSAQAFLAPETAPIPPMKIEEIRKSAAKAYGGISDQETWHMQGVAHFHGAEQAFEMFFDARFRFRMTMTGAESETDAFDGSHCWVNGPSEVPHRLILHDRDMNRLVAWAITGFWAAKSAPLLCEMGSTAVPGKRAILLKPRDGIASATLLLNAATFLPDSLRYWTDSGEETWDFSNYRAFDGRRLPTHILHRSGKQDDTIDLVSADRAEADASRYKMAKPDTANAEFDTAVNAAVEIKRIAGLMFVHPRLDGQDVGWFFLDTGADRMCLDPKVAKKLSLPVIGGDTTAGVVGVTHLDICRAATFQLGPLTIKNPTFLELDLAETSQILHLPIAGICGYDFMARTSLDINPVAGTMRVFKPGAVVLPSGKKWTKIGFDSNIPCQICSFAGDNSGFFSLDTGSTSTVDFFTPAVERFHLLKYQDTTRNHTGGAGGTAESRQGQIEWFQIGEKTFDKPTVGFQLTKSGIFTSPYRVGNIGMGFLGQFRLLLDYANERIAFVSVK